MAVIFKEMKILLEYKKTIRKTFAVIMSLIIALSVFSAFAYGISESKGLNALRKQFSRSSGPKQSGFSIDYSFYSPVKGKNDKTKYPLVIFMAGATEGTYKGKEIVANNFPLWSADEYQSRFKKSEGAYLLFARAPEEKMLCWDSSLLTSALKAAIDDFAKKNKNVDTSRIYIVSWCLGCVGAVKVATAYPDFFAGIVLFSSPEIITSAEAEKLKNTAVWLVNSKTDSYTSYTVYCVPSWKHLKSKTANKSNIRLTTFSSVPNAGALLNHNTWGIACNDMKSNSNYKKMKTVDGSGKEVKTGSMIQWLSSKSSSTKIKSCDCACHSTIMLTKVIWKVRIVIYRSTKAESKRKCSCGAMHW